MPWPASKAAITCACTSTGCFLPLTILHVLHSIHLQIIIVRLAVLKMRAKIESARLAYRSSLCRCISASTSTSSHSIQPDSEGESSDAHGIRHVRLMGPSRFFTIHHSLLAV